MNVLKDLWNSKRWLATVVAKALAVAGGATGVLSWREALAAALAALGTFIVSQGVADHGKGAAQARMLSELAKKVPPALP